MNVGDILFCMIFNEQFDNRQIVIHGCLMQGCSEGVTTSDIHINVCSQQ